MKCKLVIASPCGVLRAIDASRSPSRSSRQYRSRHGRQFRPRRIRSLFERNLVKEGGFGKFDHRREPAPIDNQTVIRLNRDTLYSSAVFDLDAGPVTITLPDAGKRFMSLQIINEDHYVPAVDLRRRARTR